MTGMRVVCSLVPLSSNCDPRVPCVPKIIVNDTTDNVNVLAERQWGRDRYVKRGSFMASSHGKLLRFKVKALNCMHLILSY